MHTSEKCFLEDASVVVSTTESSGQYETSGKIIAVTIAEIGENHSDTVQYSLLR